jgi:rhomboid-like protein
VWGFQECQKRGYATETPRFGILTEEEYAAHPLRYRDVSANQLLEIFGTKMGTDEGNEILRIIQKRRITGTLDFEDSPSESLNIARARALIWLRENYPMDEDAAIMQRFEDEDKALAEREKNWQPQANANDALYGKSQLEAIRQRNEAKYIKEQEEAAKKQEEAIRAAGGDPNVKLVTSPNGRAVLERRTESAEWVRRYKEQARLSNLAEPPYMAKSKRLLPSGVFLVAVLLGCYLLAQNYTAPPRAARLFPDIPPAAATIMSIIAINSVIIVVWRLPPLWRFMNKHFLLIPATPHVFSIVGNTFSHHKFTHLFTNMFTLWFVGTRRKLFLLSAFSCRASVDLAQQFTTM